MYYRRFSQEPYLILDLSCLGVLVRWARALAEGMGKVVGEEEEVPTFPHRQKGGERYARI